MPESRTKWYIRAFQHHENRRDEAPGGVKDKAEDVRDLSLHATSRPMTGSLAREIVGEAANGLLLAPQTRRNKGTISIAESTRAEG